MLIKQHKRENISVLLTKSFYNFNKTKYIFHLHSKEYAAFFYTFDYFKHSIYVAIYVAFFIYVLL